MNLDFLSSSERRGVTIILISDGTERGRMKLERLQAEIERRTRKNILKFSMREIEAKKLVEHFHLRGSQFVLLVKNSDHHLHHVWHDDEHLDASHIIHMAEQAG